LQILSRLPNAVFSSVECADILWPPRKVVFADFDKRQDSHNLYLYRNCNAHCSHSCSDNSTQLLRWFLSPRFSLSPLLLPLRYCPLLKRPVSAGDTSGGKSLAKHQIPLWAFTCSNKEFELNSFAPFHSPLTVTGLTLP